MNRVKLSGNIRFGAPFGEVCAVYAGQHVAGNGHGEYVYCHFQNGLLLEMSPETATELARRLPEAIAGLPIQLNCSGAVADLEEES